jgi:antitoxin component HigA of HigAB toxin-antitoxin module
MAYAAVATCFANSSITFRGGGVCDMESVHLIRTEAEYKAALTRAEQLMEAEAGTAQGDELKHLAMVIEAYEDKHHPIEPPDPIAAIHFRMEQEGPT